MSRITASSHGEARVRMLRVVHRGDRHDPRDLTFSFRFEGDYASAFIEGRTDSLLPGETLKNLVQAAMREHGAGEIETLGLALCAEVLGRQPRITRARVEIAEARWHRLEAGGKVQSHVFVGGSSERRTAVVTSNGTQVSVVSGLDRLPLLRSAGFMPQRPPDDGFADGLQRLLVGEVSARWTYTSGDVTFGPYRQGIRAAILETAAWHASRSVQHALYATADVLLSTYDEIADVTLAFHERPYRPADPLASSSAPSPDDVYVAIDEPVGIVEVTVERS